MTETEAGSKGKLRGLNKQEGLARSLKALPACSADHLPVTRDIELVHRYVRRTNEHSSGRQIHPGRECRSAGEHA